MGDQGAGGIVDCAETYDVSGEYLRIPVEERSAAGPDGIQLANGWACGTYDRESMTINCGKNKSFGKFGLAFHTEPV